jgi:ribosomal protein L37AE/L43A
MDAMGEPCPHCGSLDVDRGFTGLDQCNACSGLSRNGKTLTEVEAQFERDGDDTEELSRLNGLFKKLRKK